MLMHVREQHPVGQGFFHAAALVSGADARRYNFTATLPEGAFSYVYDCGSVNRHAYARSVEIARRRNLLGGKLDVLFLSHLHDDHVNGVPALLDGVYVDTVVMPLVGVAERLIAFAGTMVERTDSTEFFRDLAIDPAGTLASRFRPRQLVFVRSPRNDGRAAAFADGDADPPPVDGPARERSDGETSWRLVGRGRAEWGKPDDGSGDESVVDDASLTTDDINALAVELPDSGRWQLSPYIQRNGLDEQRFLDVLANLLEIGSSQSLEAELRSTSFRKALMQSKAGAAHLRTAYKAAFVGRLKGRDPVNLTTMSVFSGPVGRPRRPWCGPARNWTFLANSRIERRGPHGGPAAWLGTGDADLRAPDRLAAFLAHYGTLITEVHTLTVPHHGSERDSDFALYDNVKPQLCVTAAGAFGRWRHPASSVIRDIASAGAIPVVVTTEPLSRMNEVCYFP